MKLFYVFFCCFGFSLTVFSRDCLYKFDPDHSVIQGIGYKFTEKTGVNGSFTGFKLNKNEKKKSIRELLKDLVVTVDLKTLDSGDSMRDKNILETLFSGFSGGPAVTVSVEKVTDGTIETQLKMNNRSRKVMFTYEVKAGVLKAEGNFDILEYALGEQMGKFKKRCGLFHTGKDKKSVTWTDFGLSVTAKIIKTCPGKKAGS